MGDENTSVEVMDPASMSASQIDAFMDKGELPSRPDEAQAGQPEVSEVETEDEGSVQIDDEPAETQERQQEKPEKHLSRAERRNIRLNDELRQTRAELERLRTERQPATRQDAEPVKKSDRKAAPRLKDFETVEKWEDARDAYDAEMRRADIADMFAERESKASQEREQSERVKAVEKTAKDFVARVGEYRKTLKDDDFPECLQEVTEAVGGHLHLADAIAESEVGPRLISHFAEHPEELAKLKAMSTEAAMRAFGRLEADPRFKPVAPKTKTSARRISDDIGGRGGSSDIDDQISEALARGDNKTANRLLDQQEKLAAGR